MYNGDYAITNLWSTYKNAVSNIVDEYNVSKNDTMFFTPVERLYKLSRAGFKLFGSTVGIPICATSKYIGTTTITGLSFLYIPILECIYNLITVLIYDISGENLCGFRYLPWLATTLYLILNLIGVVIGTIALGGSILSSPVHLSINILTFCLTSLYDIFIWHGLMKPFGKVNINNNYFIQKIPFEEHLNEVNSKIINVINIYNRNNANGTIKPFNLTDTQALNDLIQVTDNDYSSVNDLINRYNNVIGERVKLYEDINYNNTLSQMLTIIDATCCTDEDKRIKLEEIRKTITE